MFVNRPLCRCLPLALALMLPTCILAATKVTVMKYPEVAEAISFKTIMIGNVSGPNGAIVAQDLEAMLVNAKVQDKPVFRSVTRGVAGKADGVLTAEVLKAGAQDEAYKKTDTVCDRYKDLPKDASGFRKIFGKECASERKVDKPCTRRRAEFSLSVRLADAANKRVVYSDVISRSAMEEACQGDSRNVSEVGVMIGRLYTEAMQLVKNVITPTTMEIPLVLKSPDDAISKSEDSSRFENAIRFAEQNRLDRACDMFRELLDSYRSSSVALNYNLGFCEEASGNLWEADENYRRADKLTNEPDKMLADAMARVQATIKKLDAHGKLRPDLFAKTGSAVVEKPVVQPMLAVATASSGPIPPELLMMDKRVALVIGNSKYPTMPLPNPANDGSDMAAALRKLKFDVIYAENAKLRDMDRAFDEFSRRLKPGGVALVFYAGHGIQLKGENFLVPVDAQIENEREAERQTFALNTIMDRLDAAKSTVNIVILDACRNNPFTRSWKRSAGNDGLVPVQAPSGTLVAYSTAPGKTAEDGNGRNSPFTKSLIKALAKPNLKLEDTFKLAARGVMQDTQSRQVPWNNSSVTGDFYFSASSVGTANSAVITEQVAAPVVQALAETDDSGPKKFCADQPDRISRNLCVTQRCKDPRFAKDPSCNK